MIFRNTLRIPSFTAQFSSKFVLRTMSTTSEKKDPFRPAKRIESQKQDVWYVLCSVDLCHDPIC